MGRSDNFLAHTKLSHGAFFEAVRASSEYSLRKSGDDVKICRIADVKGLHPVYTVKRGAVLPETSLFSSKDRNDIAFYLRDLRSQFQPA